MKVARTSTSSFALVSIFIHSVASFTLQPIDLRCCLTSYNVRFQTSTWRCAERGDSQEGEALLESLGLDPQKREALLDYSIDSFLRGDYDRPFADDAAAPLPRLSPGDTVDAALRALRQLDDPEPSHGAAVLLRFCAPLTRGERWGGAPTSGRDDWKELLRGSLTPIMMARRIRASQQFSGLLDWVRLDVTEGATGREDLVGVPTVAYVNAALHFEEDGAEPIILQFKLIRLNGVFMIDSVRRSENELFMEGNR